MSSGHYDARSRSSSPSPVPSTRTPSPSVASVSSLSRLGSIYRAQDFASGSMGHHLPSAADRQTCYTPEPPSPLADYAAAPSSSTTSSSSGGSGSPGAYRRSIAHATSALYSKLPPLLARANTSAASVAGGARAPRRSAKHASRASLFGDLFSISGTSAPVQIGLVAAAQPHHHQQQQGGARSEDEMQEERELRDEMEALGREARRPQTRARRSSTLQFHSAAGKLGGWFARSGGAEGRAALDEEEEEEEAPDPLLSLDVGAALFPHGPPDPLDPASFHDLLAAAEALLLRFQTAYRAAHHAARDAKAEMDVQREELDGAETRARHLKMQLDGMAARAGEREREIEELVEELDRERRERREEEERRRRSVRWVKDGAEMSWGWKGERSPGSDSGFESGAESEGEGLGEADAGEQPAQYQSEELTLKGPTRTNTLKRSNATRRQRPQSVMAQHTSCQNCSGGYKASCELLKSENGRLRMRVSELEQAVDGCLNMVSGLGL